MELSYSHCYFTGLWITYNVHYLENVFLLQLIIAHFDKWMTIMSSLIYEIEDLNDFRLQVLMITP